MSSKASILCRCAKRSSNYCTDQDMFANTNEQNKARNSKLNDDQAILLFFGHTEHSLLVHIVLDCALGLITETNADLHH